ncbi:unnamed protein product [Rotaria magnacalcarata]|uniref:Uncharacterized protein n=1 Tax=Rotaria magnacalcarata TaxID=392030 RepID=A0A820IHZ3_9BILA|nr:unnamed protein product [Rotaria magnacalcarata]CAF4307689.1 unnamed protein product [Rotaria magnacalcarata]
MADNKKRIIEKNRKLVIVGDGMCGKTCLLYSFVYNTFDSNHTPTIFDTYAASVQVEDKKITLTLFDTAGQEDFDRLRPLSYNDTNIVLICFNIDNQTSAKNVTEKWYPEIHHYCATCPIILVGCKKDLRTDLVTITDSTENCKQMLSIEDGKRLAAQIHADVYMECSAKTGEGVQDLFFHAAHLSLEKRSRQSTHHRCLLH